MWSPGCTRHRGPYVRPGPAAETKQFRLPYDRRSRKEKYERRGVITLSTEGEGGGVGVFVGAADFDLPTDPEDGSETQTHKARALMEGEKERKDIKSKAADKLLCV